MGKHKNTSQEGIFIRFMEQHKDLARGFMKGDRVVAEDLWENLKNDLNSDGPPQKDASGWKKVWTDWKSSIRKKLSHNKAENISTGGGPFNKFVVSPTEDTIARICGIHTVIDGIADTLDFGLEDEIEDEFENSIENKKIKVHAVQDVAEPAITASTTRKRQAGSSNLDDSITKQTKALEKIGEKMEGVLEASSKRARVEKDIEHSLRKLQRSVDSIKSSFAAKNEETKRHNHEMEKIHRDKILLRQREIEIKEMKLNILKESETED